MVGWKQSLPALTFHSGTTNRECFLATRALEEFGNAVEVCLKNQWVIDAQEVQLTSTEVGRGGWGEVIVAKFRGSRVAAKLVHSNLMAYDFVRNQFAKEMNLCAKIRHPNIIQFIGASLSGAVDDKGARRKEMVILSELLPTNLRDQLHQALGCSLTPQFVCCVVYDIAKGLNYLHWMKPDPMIHRDISSANILLEPLADHKWKAKIADFGSANLLQLTQTAHPGTIIYEAPEAKDPTKHTPKMDVFSLGILLVEICTRAFPEIGDQSRLIEKIRNSNDHNQWVDLIEQCIQVDIRSRPSAADVILEVLELSRLMNCDLE